MKTPDDHSPVERIYDLDRLSEAGYETEIVLNDVQRRELAGWVDVVGVNKFEGRVSLRRLSASRFAYTAHLDADIVQSCTVTLDPVYASISIDFTRSLLLVRQVKKVLDFSGELSAAAGEDDVPEEIDSTRYDLAAPLLEEFSLAIDPYPRAPGVAFEAGEKVADAPESPFAVLKALK
jgi:hypothetical protein